ncbi:NmrA family protein [Novosphingobium barchaimii LL02]|uniref:NmrA family protein n=1 Tax=Novosphingobium barchaimii LL02 TaxID=1114963 RepID=A0A0J7Y644_9SPHN|nr:NmrA/HSCARG family protein [Novosphingobium barchaimii]KMS59351.1 NmrA family protein [Novosphingobium barchaimii LL02]
MSHSKQPIVVFGATGQQGGSVAAALLKAGWPVVALVRDPTSARALTLRAAGVELVQGSYADTDAIRTAMRGAYGVFSVQQSSPSGGVTDEEEVRFGISIADLAVEAGIAHLVYSSGGAVSETPTGMGHFDSKMRIEAHIRTLPIRSTIIRPVAFVDMLVMPGFGLDTGHFSFFMHPDQSIQLLAVEDIGKFVEPIFADPERFADQTFEIASDSVTGEDLGCLFSEAAGRPIRYARFSDEVLQESPFLAGLTALIDQGPLAGNADLDALRKINPAMQSVREWLAGAGRAPFLKALGASGTWEYDRG